MALLDSEEAAWIAVSGIGDGRLSLSVALDGTVLVVRGGDPGGESRVRSMISECRFSFPSPIK